jgi:glutamate-1-semialdehyde aminotransferase
MGNGMPIAAVAGRWDVMSVFEEVFFSGTHGGETLSLAAAAAVLDQVADGVVLRQIETRGASLLTGMRERIQNAGVGHRIAVSGEPQRAVVTFTGVDPLVDKSWIQQCFAEDGILFNGSMFISACHGDDDIVRTLDSFERGCAWLTGSTDVTARLRGTPIQPVFRPVR